MIKKLRYLFTLMLLLVASVGWANESIVTASKVSSSTATWTGTNNVTWTVAVTDGALDQNAINSYVQIGTKADPSTSISFSTSGISGTITKIVVDCASYNGLGTVSTTVGGNAFGEEKSIPKWSSNAGDEVTFEGSASGSVVVTMTNGSGGRAMYIKSITVTYDDGSTPVVTIPAPVLSPEAGEVASGTTVTISNLNNNYLYYYTDNGVDPAVDEEGLADNESTKAFPTAGVTLTAATTLKVIATDGEGHVSNITTAAYTIAEPEGDYRWEEVALADLTASDVFVIVGNNYAMTNDNGTSSAPATIGVTIEGVKITSNVANNMKWTVSGDATNGYTFYPAGSAETWLYCNTTANSSSNNNMRVGTGDRKLFEQESTTGYIVTKDTYVKRYLSIYNDQDWRGYTTTSNGAVEVKFYKRVDNSTPEPAYITASDVELAYNATSGTIAYNIHNPVTGTSLEVNTTDEWVTLGTISDNEVAFTCTANEDATERTATVTLTYGTATTEVTITQAGNPDVTDKISDITAEDTYKIKGTIVARSNAGFIVGDGTGYVYYYNYNYSQDDYNIGDKVQLNGSVVKYNGLFEFNSSATITKVEESSYEAGNPTVLTGAQMDERVASSVPELSKYIQYEGTLSITTNNNKTYYNVTDIDGATTAKGSISSPIEDLSSLNGKKVKVTGYYIGASSNQYYNTLIESVEEVTEAVTITISDAGYATLYYEEKNLEIPEEVKAYTATVTGTQINLNEISGVIPAGTGVVLKAAAGDYGFTVVASDAQFTGENYLHGSDEGGMTVAPEGGSTGDYKFYKLSLDAGNNPGTIGFYFGAEDGAAFQSAAHKAYLAVPVEVAGEAKGFPFGGDATGIEGLNVNDNVNTNEVYDLQGRRMNVNNMPKGIYIVNGKKVVIK